MAQQVDSPHDDASDSAGKPSSEPEAPPPADPIEQEAADIARFFEVGDFRTAGLRAQALLDQAPPEPVRREMAAVVDGLRPDPAAVAVLAIAVAMYVLVFWLTVL